MNFRNIATQSRELPIFSSTIIQRLIIKIANGEPAEHEGVVYSPAEVNQMLKNQSAGLKPTKVSIYAGDYCMTQGVSVSPVFKENADPEFPVKSTANNIDIKIEELPVTGGVLDMENVSIGGKRYYLPLGLKEDIKQFAALFKYSESSSLGRKTWTYTMSLTCAWAEHGYYGKTVPYEVLQYITPDRVMSGQDLIEYLYLNKSTWGIVRTVVWKMLKDVAVPLINDDGEEVFDENGDQVYDAANDETEFDWNGNHCVGIDRVYRPSVMMFQSSKDKYQAKMQLDKLKEQVSLSNLLETHNDYYDGVDYSINCDNIRAKLTILHNLKLDALPDRVGVVTNQQEEFLVMERYFAKYYNRITLVHLTEKAAFNFSGFKIFMRPVSSLRPVEIHDKALLSRSMQENSSIIASIRANEYPDGLGFMTHGLVAHYHNGQEPREKRGPGAESTYIDMDDERAFKQLDSAMPLHFFPYVSGRKDFVDQFPDRTRSVIDDLRTHMWMLINYPVTKAPYCEAYSHVKPVSMLWTPGKTAASMAFELDSTFKGFIRTAKVRGGVVIRNRPRALEPSAPPLEVDLPAKPADPVEVNNVPVLIRGPGPEVRIVQHIPQAVEGIKKEKEKENEKEKNNKASIVVNPPKKEELPRALPRTRRVKEMPMMTINDDSDDEN